MIGLNLFSYFSVNGFCESEEAVACERLLKAYDEGDEEAARQVLSLPLVKYLDNCVSFLWVCEKACTGN